MTPLGFGLCVLEGPGARRRAGHHGPKRSCVGSHYCMYNVYPDLFQKLLSKECPLNRKESLYMIHGRFLNEGLSEDLGRPILYPLFLGYQSF